MIHQQINVICQEHDQPIEFCSTYKNKVEDSSPKNKNKNISIQNDQQQSYVKEQMETNIFKCGQCLQNSGLNFQFFHFDEILGNKDLTNFFLKRSELTYNKIKNESIQQQIDQIYEFKEQIIKLCDSLLIKLKDLNEQIQVEQQNLYEIHNQLNFIFNSESFRNILYSKLKSLNQKNIDSKSAEIEDYLQQQKETYNQYKKQKEVQVDTIKSLKKTFDTISHEAQQQILDLMIAKFNYVEYKQSEQNSFDNKQDITKKIIFKPFSKYSREFQLIQNQPFTNRIFCLIFKLLNPPENLELLLSRDQNYFNTNSFIKIKFTQYLEYGSLKYFKIVDKSIIKIIFNLDMKQFELIQLNTNERLIYNFSKEAQFLSTSDKLSFTFTLKQDKIKSIFECIQILSCQ